MPLTSRRFDGMVLLEWLWWSMMSKVVPDSIGLHTAPSSSEQLHIMFGLISLICRSRSMDFKLHDMTSLASNPEESPDSWTLED